MASEPYPDRRRAVWLLKWRPDPTGKWKVENLGKDPRLKGDRPPKTPPQFVIDRAREFQEMEYRARHGLSAGPVRPKGLAGYLTGYVDAFEGIHKTGSARQLRRHVERFRVFVQAKGVTSVQAVARSHCRDYLEARIREVSHDSLKTEMRYLAPIWSRAVEDGLMAKNPWSRLKVPGKSTRSDPVFWSEEDIARIAAHCSKTWQSDLVLVLAYTGLRISTALSLGWAWIDWGTGLVTIPREVAVQDDGVKTSYTFALLEQARAVLERRQFTTRGPLVFPNPMRGGGVVPYDSAREAIARAIRKAGVKTGTPHDIRHSYGRMLERMRLPASFIQVQLGHASPATTRIYTGADPHEVAQFFRDHPGLFPPRDPDPSRPPP
jgi:integrase